MLKDANPGFLQVSILSVVTLTYAMVQTPFPAIIEHKYNGSLFVPNTLFLFCGKSASKIKGLLWEGDGFLLLYKRVDCGHFAWPRTSSDIRSMSPEQFRWLMQGFAIDPVIHDVLPKHSA